MKTSELTGAALDWAVAKCEGLLAFGWEDDMGLLKITLSTGETEYFIPTMKWEQGGPIIEPNKIEVFLRDEEWFAYSSLSINMDFHGDTPLIAAMRCYVASKLGSLVDIPKELT
jgi:hypothetical protein